MNRMPSTQTMYQAMLKRDSSFEGVFFVAVKTTGIFCRAICPAKKPKLENVEFFPSSTDALYAGYRPCLRCQPMDREKKPPLLVERLRAAVEQSPTRKMTESELRAMGIDPSTARRQFQKYYGMTFHAYNRARRMGLALNEVRNGNAVIDAQINNGFESASGFWEAFKKIFGTPPSKSESAGCIQARWIETPLGAMIALADSEGIHMLEFADRPEIESEILALRKRTGAAIVPGTNEHLEKIADELKNYFLGKSTSFDVNIKIAGSPFEKNVWELLREIRPGETWSYAQMAERLGNPKAVRAVGRANGRNCLAIVIPCHRVIRSDGQLCGYAGGVWRKQWLLDHERRIVDAGA